MAQEKAYQRRKVFIKKRYQFYFILKFCLIILLGGVISTLMVAFLSKGTVTSSFESGRLVVRDTAEVILPTVILTNAVTVGVISVIALLTVLYVSHKIAGPMFRFEKELAAISEGDLTIEVLLRKEDQIVALSLALNKMTKALREKVSAIESEILKFQELAKQHDFPKDISASLWDLQGLVRKNFKI